MNILNKTCPECNKEFTTRLKKQVNCSVECANAGRTRRNNITFNCNHCGESCTQPKSSYNRGKSDKHYCSNECSRLGRRVETFKMNCPICDTEILRRECDLSVSGNRGKRHKNLYCSRKCKTIGMTGGDEYSPFCIHLAGARTRMIQDGTRHLLDFDKKYLKELWDTQDGKCAISGLPMILDTATGSATKKIPKHPYKASLDRIDSNKSYTKDNIQFVCMSINYMKNEFGNKEILEFVSNMKRKKYEYVENAWGSLVKVEKQ